MEIGDQNAMELLNREPSRETLDAKSEIPLDGTAKVADKKIALEQKGSGVESDDRFFGTEVFNYGFEQDESADEDSEQDEDSSDQDQNIVNLTDEEKNKAETVDEPPKKKPKTADKYENLFNII